MSASAPLPNRKPPLGKLDLARLKRATMGVPLAGKDHPRKAGSWPTSSECDAFISHGASSPALSSDNMLKWTAQNATLLEYLYPSRLAADVDLGWNGLSRGCRVVSNGCWCFHVAGSMVKALNPRGLERCAPKDKIMNCTEALSAAQSCSCFAQALPPAAPCLFGDMRPAKLLAIIAACRAAGVTHIIEQGRYGGLSAYIYRLHGFKVTSIELLPLSEVSAALRARAPDVRLLDGDGRRLVIETVRAAPPSERVAVIFDGEKRRVAYETFKAVKRKVALGIFDDTNLDDGVFPSLLRQHGEEAWHTWDCAFMRRHTDEAPLDLFSQMLRGETERASRAYAGGGAPSGARLYFHGGMENLARFHSSLVRGGAWRER